ncbi:DExH-box ATP-dependent RNA helicase DExH3 isoform X2 [Coffea arabica]|uniref:RNA helicase n=1 Tax=Coffea arabica TaxID=13443 RepID=A0A6P6XIR4_COFAR
MPSYSPFLVRGLRLKAIPLLTKPMSSFHLINRGCHFYSQNPILLRRRLVPQNHSFRAGLVLTSCTCSASRSSSSGSVVVKRIRKDGYSSSFSIPPPYFYQQSAGYGRFAYDEYASEEDDYESDRGNGSREMCPSTLDNIEEWRRKLTRLMHNEDQQELVSRERKDRRDFEHLSVLATRMGLYSRQYSKVIAFSKVPLPNYRSDLDDKRPQREVVLPSGLVGRVDTYLKAYLSRKAKNKETFGHSSLPRSSDKLSANDDLSECQESPTRSVVAERILQRRSLDMRNRQQDWQESSEGQKMQEFRRSLPAYKEKEALLHAISRNQVVVVSGETGCGKTTQLPQYILESETEASCGAFCSIICTQPRRISAMAVAERVAAERGENLGDSVGYKVRLEGMKGRDTRLLFCTTGILLRRLLVDRNLQGVTHVIVDEIHERGMNEDFLLIVLKDLLPRRPELRLVLMSATLNAELFSSYFGGAPMIHIPGFTYPVRSHFLENILETIGYRLTPYNQIDNYGQDKMWKMQKQALRKRKTQIASAVEDALDAADFKKYSPRTRESLSCWNPDSIGFNLIEHVLCHICQRERPGAILVFMTGWDDINALKDQLEAHPLLGDPSRVLLLACHGSMASSEQKLIFNKPEGAVRKIVLATNMAETSITINDVVFVVDCGKAKETSYDALNNTPCLLPTWISQAAARQRRGRAGRVQPGECYHLYPRCVHDAFSDYQLPELLRTPLQSLCLQIKSLKLGSISEFLSKALQPPELLSVQNAIEYLKIIGALDEDENLTMLGKNLSMLPVEPKLGKMLILGSIFNCLGPILTVVAGLSVRDPFLMPFDKKDLAESAKAQFSAREFSDHLALVRAFEGWKEAEKEQSGYEYCWRNFLSAQTLKAIDSLRKQFFHLLKDIGLVDDIESCNQWSHDQHLIRAVICAGLFPGICSIVNKEKSVSLKTMEDGLVLLHSLLDPKLDISSHDDLLSVVRFLVSQDQCEGRFVFGRQMPTSLQKAKIGEQTGTLSVGGGHNSKSQLQTLLARAGHQPPMYKTKQLKNNKFRSSVTFSGLDFVGQPRGSKKDAEKDAAAEALQWLTGESQSTGDTIDNMSAILKKSKKKQHLDVARWR